MTGLYVLGAICAVLCIAAIVLLLLIFRKKSDVNAHGASVDDLVRENDRLKNELDTAIKINNTMLTGAINAQTNNIGALAERMDRFAISTQQGLADVRQSTAKSIADLRLANEQSIKEMKADNAVQLDKMRQTVDEKLSATLEQRFNQSFKIVNDSLEEINRSFGE